MQATSFPFILCRRNTSGHGEPLAAFALEHNARHFARTLSITTPATYAVLTQRQGLTYCIAETARGALVEHTDRLEGTSLYLETYVRRTSQPDPDAVRWSYVEPLFDPVDGLPLNSPDYQRTGDGAAWGPDANVTPPDWLHPYDPVKAADERRKLDREEAHKADIAKEADKERGQLWGQPFRPMDGDTVEDHLPPFGEGLVGYARHADRWQPAKASVGG